MIPRILIVDDDPDMVELLRLALTEAGFSVRTATDGQEALRKALRAPPDLVVLDLVLPGMNGFSLCEQLRLNPACCFGKHAGAVKSLPARPQRGIWPPVGPIAISCRLPQPVSEGDSVCS